MTIPVMKPMLAKHDDVAKYLKSMDLIRNYSNYGPFVRTLEERYALFFDVAPNRVVCSANATLALFGACTLDESESIIVPSFTFPATIQAAIASHKKIIISDIDPSTWMLPEDEIKDKSRIVVLPFGSKGKFELDSTGTALRIVDAAASIGNFENNLGKMSQNEVIIFSLHATKILGLGEGAISVFGCDELASQFRSWINFGFAGTRNSVHIGINAKMSEISAAYGLAALDAWQSEKTDWLHINGLQHEIEQSLGISPYFSTPSNISPYWIVEFENEFVRDLTAKLLHLSKVDSRLWWEKGCHLMPAFREFAKGYFPNTEAVANRILGLPKYRDLDKVNIDLIGEILHKTLQT